MLKLPLQGSVFVNDQNVTMIDSMSISTMTHIRPWVPAVFKFTNSISTKFWTEEVFKKRTASRQIGIIFKCYIMINMAKIWIKQLESCLIPRLIRYGSTYVIDLVSSRWAVRNHSGLFFRSIGLIASVFFRKFQFLLQMQAPRQDHLPSLLFLRWLA